MARLLRQQRRTDEDADLGILIALDVLEIGGEEITVREYSLMESLCHRKLFAPLIEALRERSFDDGLEGVLDVLGDHAEAVAKMVSISCGKPVEWVQGLPTSDGESLLFSWWTVNSDFFVRAVVRPAIERAAREARQRAGQTSSPASSSTATMPNESLTTPPAS